MTPAIRSIELSGRVRLSYAEQGDPSGVPMILLHGVTDSWRSFGPALPHLPPSIHAFALTQRGHGDAERPAAGYRTRDFAGDVAAFADAFDLGPAVVVGHSMADASLLKQAIARAEILADPLTVAFAHSQYGNHLGNTGQFEESLTHLRRAIDIYGSVGARYDQAINMVIGGRCYSSRTGRIEDALDYAARAREIDEALGDPRLRAYLAMEGEPYFYKGLWTEVVRTVEANLPVAFEIGEWNVIPFSSAWLGIAYVKLGRLGEARRVLELAAREGRARLGLAFATSFVLIALAQLHVALGEPGRAVEAARESLALSERGRFQLEQGAAHRILGEALAAGQPRGGGRRVPEEPPDPRGHPVPPGGGPDAPRPRPLPRQGR